MNVFRDPAKNVIISHEAETDPFEAAKPENRARRRPGLSTGQSPYSPVIKQIEAVWAEKEAKGAATPNQTIG